jgi:hypothetical protein
MHESCAHVGTGELKYRYLEDPSIWINALHACRLKSQHTTLIIMAGGAAPTGPSASPLGQAWGYGIVLGIGFLFALGMVCLALLQQMCSGMLTM